MAAAPNQLSFLPDDYLERKAQRRANAICGVLFVCVMGGLGSAFTLTERATKAVDAEYAAVEAQYVAEAKRIQQVKEMRNKHKRMAHQAEMTSSLLERVPRSNILAELTNSLPAGVSLLDFHLESKPAVKLKEAPASAADAAKTAYEQKKAAKAKAGGGGANEAALPAGPEPKKYDVTMKVTGIAQNDKLVARYMTKLQESPLFRDVNLLVTEEHELEREKQHYEDDDDANGNKRPEAERRREKKAQRPPPVRKFQIAIMLNPEAEIRQEDVERQKAAAAAAVEVTDEK